MTVLDDEAGVRTQFLIWGYALTGRTCETAALVAEGHGEMVRGGGWDRTAADLTGSMISRGGGRWERIGDWAALPWLVEHLTRRPERWPEP